MATKSRQRPRLRGLRIALVPEAAPGGGNSVLHLVTPGLLDRVAEWGADYGGVGRYPNLEWLLARATAQSRPVRGAEATLSALFGIEVPVPAGALTRLALTGEQDAGLWMCVEPVHLEAGVTDLVLTGPDPLRLQAHEARALVARINDHLAPENLAVEATAPGHWHLCLPSGFGLPETDALTEVLGRPVNTRLPRGADARDWHRRINELQMVLFDAPENRAREARGLPTVNSVWLWGAGSLPESLAAPAERIYGDGPLLAGLARRAGVPCETLPETAEPVLATAGTRLVYLDVLLADAAGDDLQAWQASLEGLERAWFAPLRRALGSSRLTRLIIHSGCGPVFVVDSGARWRLWRRARPLVEFAP
jgi:hypothetical protein